MQSKYNTLGDEMFSGVAPRILVMNTEHNGSVYKHAHSFTELVFIESGFALHSCNGSTTVLTAGDMFIIHPGDAHSYVSAYHTNLYNCLFYTKDLGDDICNELEELPGLEQLKKSSTPRILHIDISERREFARLLEKIQWERQNRAAGWELAVKSLFTTFLVRYSRLAASSPAPDGESDNYTGYVCRVLRYIEENYRSTITQEDLAEAAGLSCDYMSRRFKAAMSMTPSEYIRKFRIAKSIELLRTTTKSVSEIAAECGFSDITLYSRVFKQTVGITPVQFRKSETE